MPFPFSFVFAVPGTPNPFTPQGSRRPPASSSSPTASKAKLGMNGKLFGANSPVKPNVLRRRPPTTSLEPSPPTSRKRGWVPSSSEPSIPATVSATVQTSTSGHLGASSPRPMQQNTEQHQRDEMEGDLPPPKRRKTLAGSIVSTALSAALIGTAVGLTVYRLWKGKGRDSEAPPPYDQGEWVHPPGHKEAKNDGPHYIPQPEPSLQPEINNFTSPSARSRRPRHSHVAGRRTAQRHRKVPARTQPSHAQSPNFSPPPSTQFAVPPQFNFGSPEPEEDEQDPDVSDQMDWIGDRLAQLIEEGKKALGKEIVVMSETKEDEEDDGSGQWEDDMPVASTSSGSFRKSRSKRPRSISVSSPPPGYLSPQTTPRTPQKGRFDPYARSSSSFNSPGNRSRRDSVDSARSFALTKEDESTYESAELRESMEKARQAYLQRRQQQQMS